MDDPTVWNVRSLKEHFDALRAADQRLLDERHTAQLRAIDAALAARDKGIEAALQGLNERLKTLNELRGVVTDQQSTFLTRVENDAARGRDEGGRVSSATSIRGNIALVGTGVALLLSLAAATGVFAR